MKPTNLEQQRERVVQIIYTLRDATKDMIEPAVTQIIAEYGRDPFLILVSCLLSLRTKDTVSLPASRRLFQFAKNPSQMLELDKARIEKLIYPVGFYRRKAQQLHEISADILKRFDGKVPGTEADLLSFKGVGRKTANLVLGEGFGIPAICVDTHVHRLSNHFGLVTTTKTPEETEMALRELLPQEYWIEYNRLLVMWGQHMCASVGPCCLKCARFDLCPKVGVKRSC